MEAWNQLGGPPLVRPYPEQPQRPTPGPSTSVPALCRLAVEAILQQTVPQSGTVSSFLSKGTLDTFQIHRSPFGAHEMHITNKLAIWSHISNCVKSYLRFAPFGVLDFPSIGFGLRSAPKCFESTALMETLDHRAWTTGKLC